RRVQDRDPNVFAVGSGRAAVSVAERLDQHQAATALVVFACRDGGWEPGVRVTDAQEDPVGGPGEDDLHWNRGLIPLAGVLKRVRRWLVGSKSGPPVEFGQAPQTEARTDEVTHARDGSVCQNDVDFACSGTRPDRSACAI